MRAIRKHVQVYCTELTFYFGPSKEIKQNPNATDGWKTKKNKEKKREKQTKIPTITLRRRFVSLSACTRTQTDVDMCAFSHRARARRTSTPSSSTSLDNFRGWRIMITANTANITVEIQITILYRGDVKYRVYTVRYLECGTKLCSRINMDSEKLWVRDVRSVYKCE